MTDNSAKGCAVCGEVYQVVGALRDGANGAELEPVLDNLSASARGEPVPHSSVLPFEAQSQLAQLIAEIEACTRWDYRDSDDWLWPGWTETESETGGHYCASTIQDILDRYRSKS